MIEDEVPELIDTPVKDSDNCNDSDEDFDGDEELMDFCQEPCKDLFSNQVFKTPSECLTHCKINHGFDLIVSISYQNPFSILALNFEMK